MREQTLLQHVAYPTGAEIRDRYITRTGCEFFDFADKTTWPSLSETRETAALRGVSLGETDPREKLTAWERDGYYTSKLCRTMTQYENR